MKGITAFIYSFIFVVILGASGQDEVVGGPVRIGVLPDAGVLPLYLMDNVEVIPFMSAKERETALQLGELDGVTTDLVSVVANGQKGMAQKVLTVTESRFIIVGQPVAEINLPWEIGISENTIIEFMVDQLTAGREVEKISIPQVPVRMEMVRNGKISMACLTDAMAWPLLSQGFQILADQNDSGLEPAVLAFSDDFLERNPTVVETFTQGWNRAVQEINSHPDDYRGLLLEEIRLPDDSDYPYPVPLYHAIKLPGEETVQVVLEWFEEKYGLENSVSYFDLVVASN